MRTLAIAAAFLATLVSHTGAAELRWSFDSLAPDALVGDAAVEAIGPTSKDFEGLPESNVALRLDGSGDYVRVPDEGENSPLDFHQDDPITIEAWVRLDRINNDQNVYIVGKGRTHRNGPKDNQNYALRLRGVGRDARISFLFRSVASEDEKSDWHRWTSKPGFGADGSWHHVAVSYKFGDPKSIHGYIDGKSVTGGWDMGGATTRAPVVDDDDLWIGSALGGSAGNSFKGAIDEVVIQRAIVAGEQFAKRRVVIQHPPQPPRTGLIQGAVNVRLFEGLSSEGAWPIKLPEPLVQYQQTAFGFPRIPLAYGPGGVRRDWSGPVMLSAMAEVDLPGGETEWMLRAGGLSRLWIGDEIVASTPVHLGNASGHGEVTRYQQDDPWLRPPRAGHHEELATHALENAGPVLVTLESMIGGEKIRYEPGEILVAYRTAPDDPWQVLSFVEPIPLTDATWNRYTDQVEQHIQSVDDANRRLTASVEDDYWYERHQRAREFIRSLPPIAVPPRSVALNSAGAIDDFLNARIEQTGQSDAISSVTSDEQFIRRLYLDCVGVIPSLEEIDAFTSTQVKVASTERRADLIDLVLDDPRWADHWTSYWMDVLAENPNVLKPSLNNTGPFRWYLYDVMRDSVPVDRWVTGLLRMEGSTLGGGPAGFAMAAQNDVPMAAKAHIVSSAFLGANLKCARCHDAPYHDWTQRDLFSIAAMLQKKPVKIPKTSSVPAAFFADQSEASALIRLSLKPGEEVQGVWPLSGYTSDIPLDDQLLARSADSRDTLAAYVTRGQNQQFARTIVNRLWERLMGEGIVHPVDDWEGADPSHPQLLDFLARELVAAGYDFKHVACLILNSQAYQRRAVDRPVILNEQERLFLAPRQRRMSAEQVVDSMHVAVGRAMDCDELSFDPEARMNPSAMGNLGRPKRAWQLTSLSNERDRPALSLPKASAVTECLEAFGWRGARQEPINHRQTDANVIQPGILAGGLLSIQLTRLTDHDSLTTVCVSAETPDQLVDYLFQRFLTRTPNEQERERFVQTLTEGFEDRVLATLSPAETPIREPIVSWANHLHPEATKVRLRESQRLRQGPPASTRLQTEWRERAEDVVWALINTPEFLFVP